MNQLATNFKTLTVSVHTTVICQGVFSHMPALAAYSYVFVQQFCFLYKQFLRLCAAFTTKQYTYPKIFKTISGFSLKL